MIENNLDVDDEQKELIYCDEKTLSNGIIYLFNIKLNII